MEARQTMIWLYIYLVGLFLSWSVSAFILGFTDNGGLFEDTALGTFVLGLLWPVAYPIIIAIWMVAVFYNLGHRLRDHFKS
jgi:hypothetical protein